MCEHCENKKAVRSVTFNGDTSFSIFKNQLYVDGDIVFKISYCPMCRKKVRRIKSMEDEELDIPIKNHFMQLELGICMECGRRKAKYLS